MLLIKRQWNDAKDAAMHSRETPAFGVEAEWV